MIHITETAFERMQNNEAKLAAMLDSRIRALPTDHLEYCAAMAEQYQAAGLRVYFYWEADGGSTEYTSATAEQLRAEIELRKTAPQRLHGVAVHSK